MKNKYLNKFFCITMLSAMVLAVPTGVKAAEEADNIVAEEGVSGDGSEVSESEVLADPVPTAAPEPEITAAPEPEPTTAPGPTDTPAPARRKHRSQPQHLHRRKHRLGMILQRYRR